MTIKAFALDPVSGSPSYSGQDVRTILSALMGTAPSGRPLGASSGVRQGTPSTTVTVSGSTVTVAPHSGIIDAETAATAGAYLYAVTANETPSIAAAHATLPRIDLVSVQISDPSQGDGTSTPGAAVVVTTGTAASTPAAPATPARSLALARISVPASGGGAATAAWIGGTTDDSGWVNMTPQGSFTADSITPQARQIGIVVYLRGGVVQAGFSSTAYTDAVQIDTSKVAVPPNTAPFALPGVPSTGVTRRARVLTSGKIQVATSAASGEAFSFDGMTYLVN